MRTLWSVKGGAGVTVVTAAIAAAIAHRGGRALVVDLAGDQAAALGAAEPTGPGVTDWLASDGPPQALARLATEVAPGLSLLHRGGARRWPGHRSDALAAALAAVADEVVVDGGQWDGGVGADDLPPTEDCARRLAASGVSWLVTRSCFLAVRRATTARRLGPDGVVVVEEPGRALDGLDVGRVLQLPVVVTVRAGTDVARAVDAHGLAGRLPRSLGRALVEVA